MNPRELHRVITLVVSAALVVLGLALIVQGAAAAHGVNVTRLLLGALFVGAGTARLVVQLRGGRGGG